jgi:stage V sporulation protein AD
MKRMAAMSWKISRATAIMEKRVPITAFSSIVGKEEAAGPLGRYFDESFEDAYFGKDTWEQGEAELFHKTVKLAMKKSGINPDLLDYIVAGDLLNQCASSTYGINGLDIPYIGIYSACSTISEGLMLGALLTDSGLSNNLLVSTSSHFAAAERQFRFPLHYGGVRTPTAQWTCTASGAIVISAAESLLDTPDCPLIKAVTTGKIVDYGVIDASNMGAAMAPAAADTIKTFLCDTKMSPTDFDAIVTGDLGQIGTKLLIELLNKDNIEISGLHNDCGCLIFDDRVQDVHAGGSGAGCSAAVLAGYFLPKMKRRELKNILFCATGALMSTTLSQQGSTIPCISHAVHISIN